jgi:hypothetical protein
MVVQCRTMSPAQHAYRSPQPVEVLRTERIIRRITMVVGGNGAEWQREAASAGCSAVQSECDSMTPQYSERVTRRSKVRLPQPIVGHRDSLNQFRRTQLTMADRWRCTASPALQMADPARRVVLAAPHCGDSASPSHSTVGPD